MLPDIAVERPLEFVFMVSVTDHELSSAGKLATVFVALVATPDQF
jgi:hypothetical protein